MEVMCFQTFSRVLRILRAGQRDPILTLRVRSVTLREGVLIYSSNYKLFARYWDGSRRLFFKPDFVVQVISIPARRNRSK